MTHVCQRNSLCGFKSESVDQVSFQTHAETMDRTWPECSMQKKAKICSSKREKSKEIKEKNTERDRKLYPLRGRHGLGEVGTLNCCVVLMRLDESGTCKNSMKALRKSEGKQVKELQGKAKICKCRKKACKSCRSAPEPKSKVKPDKYALYTEFIPEPRQRRLASLNAEAVNSLLLDRDDPQQTSKLSKKKQQQTKGGSSLSKDTVKDNDCSRKGQDNRKRVGTGDTDQRKKLKKAKKETEGIDLQTLNSRTPKRLAGLTAATLLKLTSTSSEVKRRGKTDSKPSSAGSRGKQLKDKSHKQQLNLPCQSELNVSQQCCSLCEKQALHWDGSTGSHGFISPGYQCRSMLGYPLKPVKEEKTETDVKSYYCCSQERSVEYCHRLALFLGQKAYPETDEHSIKGFIPASHTLSHPAMPMPIPCYSGYYVHIAHHGTPPHPVSSNPGTHAPSTLCPTGVQRPKLLPSSVSHTTGIPHPAYCNSVGTCCGEPCRLSSYTYRPTQPITSRGCSYNPGCSSCMHKMETEDYSYPLDDHSSSFSMPSALPLSICPISSVPPPTQSVPHLQSPLPDSGRPQVQIRVGRECPQRAKAPSGSCSGVRNSAAFPHIKDGQLGAGHGSTAAKQSKINHHRATNGWLPVGVATEKEVFIVAEDSTLLRRCYEGVQRDGEVIRVRDTVLLRSGPRKKSLPYVAKVSAFWEDPESGELMMSLFWYYRPEHTQGGRNPSMHCENEIFASRHQDENSVACIEDKCYVLTLAQFCRFCALMKCREEGFPRRSPLVPPSNYVIPAHRCVPSDIDPDLVFVCRHVYDFRFGRLLKNLQ
ncbi:bromo adjacent homology domain-containing 1 protein-like [Xyrauchen texanus]|uniref:bromo adjacent homology domain-containing 1 protein-like n=1 Tax=Xyrauchen texanus TaxID=154827 RepID=UPI002242BD02|nr:bromo adjacent homology domain-containing 1 protein-like [Xyrauchen texanus]XP_052001625.1 bromo adjacent homology domain-containing 1 protein-like [Xyrauchen texanus]